MGQNKTVPTKVLLIYVLLFFLWWSMYESLNFGFGDGEIIQSILGGCIKVITWTVPVIFLLKKYSNSVEIPLQQMFMNKVKVAPYIVTGFILVGCVVIGSIVESGNLRLNEAITMSDLIGKVLLVGITEEMVFRGWLLNAFVQKMSRFNAVLLTSFLFLCIHFPIWLREEIFQHIFLSGTFITVCFLSAIFSVSFLKSRSIWIPIVLHMVWNLSVIVF